MSHCFVQAKWLHALLLYEVALKGRGNEESIALSFTICITPENIIISRYNVQSSILLSTIFEQQVSVYG